MSEPQDRPQESSHTDVARDALIRNLISLGMTLALVAAFHPRTEVWARGQWRRIRALGGRSAAAEERAVAEFRRELRDERDR